MKKILIILSILCLFACSNKQETPDNENDSDTNTTSYIEPVSETDIFSYLNDDTKNLLYKANGNENVGTEFLQILGKNIPDVTLTDYNGNSIDLSSLNGKVVIEVVATYCSHCKEQSKTNNVALANALGDVTFVQYFANGDKEMIDAFYTEVGESIPDNIIVVPKNEELSNMLEKQYSLSATPTFYFFNEGSLTWAKIGQTTVDDLSLFSDIAFNNALDLNNLVDDNGTSIFDYVRDQSDVKNDLSNENYLKLADLDNDGDTILMTLNNMGKMFDFTDQLENESDFTSEVNFLDYTNSELMIVYVYNYDQNAVDLINEYYKENSDVSLIVLNASDEDNDVLANQLEPKMVSIMNQIPAILNDYSFSSYPSCIFVQDETITGIYSNIESVESLKNAKDIFLGENSIAIKGNNN